MRQSIHRWSSGLVGTLLLVSVALLYAVPSLFVLAVVPLGYVAYGALAAYPEPTVDIERSLSTRTPAPGEAITVTLTVENTGDRTLSDLRVVDGVPGALAVSDGRPRASMALSAGSSATLTYDVIATRGTYEFDPATVRCRSLSATRVRTETVAAEGATTLSCTAVVEENPLERAARSRVGTLPTDSGGPGLEFHSTREYRPGDSISRIDWRRLARTDELSTVNFREEHAARVVVVVDARPATRLAAGAGYPTGAELATYAGERAYEALTGAGHRASVAAIGLEDAVLDERHRATDIPWVDPGDGSESVAEARALFDTVADAADHGGQAPPTPGPLELTDDVPLAETLTARLPPDAQVLLCSPLVDDLPVSLVATVRARGVPVTVLSPDAAVSDSVGGRLAGVQRDDRIEALRLRGAGVVDWTPDEPLSVALEASLPELISV